ncbi:MAG TPA: GWxTD domain-containing protein [Vicinamibacteria bacterium]|nr:GWxTD domain-containing protein [Vicinamibacteria bacterium]
MKASWRLLVAASLLFAFAAIASPDERIDRLPEHYRKWLLEEVPYIISDGEKETFLRLESEKERETFIDVFWRKRDENPSTVENEYKEEHYRRLVYANEFLGRDTFRPGWRTDRGRYYILLGEPRSRQNFESRDGIYPAELWFYNNPELKTYALPPFFYLLFFRRHGTGEFELYDPVGDGPQALLTRVNTKSMDYRDDVERAYNELTFVDPELAKASLSFRTDEGDLAQFQATPFGTYELLNQIALAPLYGVDTSYAERLDFERGTVESDYLFRYVTSAGMINVLPGPGEASYLHWVIELPPQNVAFVFDNESGLYATAFVASIEVESKDVPGTLVMEDRKESFITLNSYEEASLHLPVSYSGMTPMVPGTYTVRVILRNRACPSRDESDCVRSYTLLDGDVTVPEWPKTPLLGDLVLAYGTELRGGEISYRSYRFGSQEILPNPSGVYSIGDAITVAATAWNAPAGGSIRFRLDSAEAEGFIGPDQTVPLKGDEPIVQELALPIAEGGRFRLTATLLDAQHQERDKTSTLLTVSPRTSIDRPSVRGSMPQIRPELPGIVSMALGEQYLALERDEKARELLERALVENKGLGPVREHLASLELEAGNSARAVELLEPVYAQIKDRVEVLSLLGQAYFYQNRFEEAVDVLEKAIALARPEPSMLNVLANASYRVGKLDRAQELLERSLSADPNQDDVKEILTKLKAERGSGPGS